MHGRKHSIDHTDTDYNSRQAFIVSFIRRLADGDDQITVQESELEAAAWFPLQEAADLPIFRGGVLKSMMDTCLAYHAGKFAGFKAEVTQDLFSKRKDLVIFPDSWFGLQFCRDNGRLLKTYELFMRETGNCIQLCYWKRLASCVLYSSCRLLTVSPEWHASSRRSEYSSQCLAQCQVVVCCPVLSLTW